MRKLLRNPEVWKGLLLYIGISVLGGLAAFWGLGVRAGIFALALGALFTVLFVWITGKRYHKIAGMAADIDRILHEEVALSLEQYAEGELAILQSEIYKMTIRLREQQQKLLDDKAYLADSLADISHQIRTPLTSVNLLLSALLEPEVSEKKRQELFQEISKLLSRIDWLITTLLKISKLDAGTVQFKIESISLKELLSKACAPLLIPAELRGQDIELEAEGNFKGDVSWTCEAIGNIVKNCVEHTPHGGQIRLMALENPLFTEIKISDNGGGISREDLPHIFERFYKGKNSGEKSFGIGLALARMIITGQGGTIKAESEKGKGTCFFIRFYKNII